VARAITVARGAVSAMCSGLSQSEEHRRRRKEAAELSRAVSRPRFKSDLENERGAVAPSLLCASKSALRRCCDDPMHQNEPMKVEKDANDEQNNRLNQHLIR